MSSPWTEIEASKEYKSLTPSEQSTLKSDYFKEVVSTDKDFKSLSAEDQSSFQSEFLGSKKEGILKKIGKGVSYAFTPFAGPERVLKSAAKSVEQADMLTPKMPTGGPLQAAAQAVQQTLIAHLQPLAALGKEGAPISPTNIAAAIAPTPADVATFGMGAFAKALRSAGLIGKELKVATELAKPVEEVFTPVKTLDEAIVRLEVAAKKAPPQQSILLPASKGTVPDIVLGTNLSKLNTTEEVKRFIADNAAANRVSIDEARRGVVSESETLRLANDLGMTTDELLKMRGSAPLAHEAIASRQAVVSSAENLVNAAKKWESGGSLADVVKLTEQNLAVQEVSSGLRAETGRALQSYKQTVGGDLGKAIELFLQNPENKMMTEEVARKLATLDPLDPRSINRFVRDAVTTTTGDKLMEVWVNLLLSGPQTHIVNSTSNALTLMTRPLLEKPARAILDVGRSAITGTQRERFIGEAGADIFGIIRGIPEGARNALMAFQDGLSSIGQARVTEAVRTASAIKGPIGTAVNIPARALTSADEFFKTISRAGEVNSLAYRSAVQKGLNGQAKLDHISSILAKQGPEAESIWKQATKEAKYRTFTQDLGPTGNAINQIRMLNPWSKVIVPFLKTPINVAKFGLERTPLNFIRLVNKHGLKNLVTKPEMIDELVKPMIGSMLAIPIASMASQGKITGGGPKDSGERAVLRASGWQPYSVKIGERYYSYGRLEPISMVVGLIADYAELNDIVDSGDFVGKIGMSIGQNLTSKTFLRGLSDLVNAVSDPERYGQSWVNRLAGTVVPTALAQLSRAQTGTIPRPRNPVESIKSRIPGLSKDIPNLRDIWGNVIVSPTFSEDGRFQTLERLASPVYISNILKDKSTSEMVRLRMGVSPPHAKISPGVELTSDELDFFVKTSGNMAKVLVDNFTNSPGYDGLKDYKKKEQIARLLSVARERTSHLMDIPRKQYEEKRKERMR